MAAALKLGVQEDVDQLECQTGADSTLAQADDMGVVVLSCGLCCEAVGQGGCTNALDLVGSDGHTDACTADQDAALGLAVYDGIGNGFGINGIMAGAGVVCALVANLMAGFCQVLLDGLLQAVACVIGTDYYFHFVFSSLILSACVFLR